LKIIRTLMIAAVAAAAILAGLLSSSDSYAHTVSGCNPRQSASSGLFEDGFTDIATLGTAHAGG